MTTTGAQQKSGLPATLHSADGKLTGGGALLNPNQPKALTPPQKAALVIAALGPDAAGPVLERIGDEHLHSFTRAYVHLQSVPKIALQAVVKEFIEQLTEDDDSINGGFEKTRELLSKFIDPNDVDRLMNNIDASGGQDVWGKLVDAGDEALAEYLASQKPQLVAVVLSKIDTEKASRVLDLFDTEIAGKVILCLSKPLDVDESTLQILGDTIERDFLAPMEVTSESHDPSSMIGSMMNNIMSEKREELLSFIADSAPEILHGVKKSMLTFQDIAVRVPPNAIPIAIREVELEEFLQAVKFGKENAPSSVEFILANISQRMAAQYQEQMEELKTITAKEAEAAQSSFMSVIRKLGASGEIQLIDPASEDEAEEQEELAS